MLRLIGTATVAAGLLISAASFAQAPAGAPAGSTGQCKDGSYTSSPTRKGACRGHQGVKEWYAAGAATSAAAKAPAAAKTPPAPAATAAPAGGVTGLCKDGTTTSSANKRGACRGHQGVKEWYGAGAAPAVPAPAAAPVAPTAAPAAAAPAAPAAPATPSRPAYTPPTAVAPGGGAGQVWVNKATKVYHCPGDRWYGRTKNGAYLSEADAKAQGFHPDHGKVCGQ